MAHPTRFERVASTFGGRRRGPVWRPGRPAGRSPLISAARKGDLRDQASPQDDRCLPQPCVGRQLLDSEPSNIGASYLAAVDACEVGYGPDAATSLVIGEPCRPDNDPIE